MSLKSIEMQIALPRSVDSAKISEQLQQRGQQIIDHATDDMKWKDTQNRQSVVEMEKGHKLWQHTDDDQPSSQYEGKQNQNKKQQQKMQEPIHPYKGKSIDYSG